MFSNMHMAQYAVTWQEVKYIDSKPENHSSGAHEGLPCNGITPDM